MDHKIKTLSQIFVASKQHSSCKLKKDGLSFVDLQQHCTGNNETCFIQVKTNLKKTSVLLQDLIIKLDTTVENDLLSSDIDSNCIASFESDYDTNLSETAEEIVLNQKQNQNLIILY